MNLYARIAEEKLRAMKHSVYGQESKKYKNVSYMYIYPDGRVEIIYGGGNEETFKPSTIVMKTKSERYEFIEIPSGKYIKVIGQYCSEMYGCVPADITVYYDEVMDVLDVTLG